MSRVIAVIAVAAGVRAGICMIAVPSSMRSVTAARYPSTLTASGPYSSTLHTESTPMLSARLITGSTSCMGSPP